MKKIGWLVATIALALPGPAAYAADWSTLGHDLSNSRSAGTDGPSPSQAGSLQRAWTFNSPHGDFTGTPVVAGGTLVAGSNLGSVYALDAATGRLRWTRELGGQINGSAAIDLRAPGGPTAFVPVARTGAPRLVALSLRTGAVRWSSVLSHQAWSYVFGSPVYWRRTVYIGTSGPNNDEATARGSVVALDETTGHLRWRTFTVPPGHDGGAVWSSPAIDSSTGRLYVGTGNAYHPPAASTTDSMLVLSAANGRLLRHFQATNSDVFQVDTPAGGPDYDFGDSPNLIAGPAGRRLVGEGQKSGTYWALDRTSMQPVWHTNAGPGSPLDGGVNSTAYDGRRIYGSDAIDSQVFALSRGGTMLWNSLDAGPLHFSPVAYGNGVLYSADPGGFLTARNPATGAVLAKLPLGGPMFGGISISGRAVYVATGTGPPLAPLPTTDTSQSDGSGSILAFGDTAPNAAATFAGSCQVTGTVRFVPGLTAAPHALTQYVHATGTCSGTFTDTAGRDHKLSNAPVTYDAREHAANASCAAGTDTGSGTVTSRYGRIRFSISEKRLGVFVALSLTGERSGSGQGAAAPTSGNDPTKVPADCAGSGIHEAQIQGQLSTTPAISG